VTRVLIQATVHIPDCACSFRRIVGVTPREYRRNYGLIL
jgi:AraC-like DNA-binding protein